MRDVVIPGALQDAMSREAQAAREKQARIILGQAEMEIAHSFQEAAKSYQQNPTALHLRAMNMLYEGLKEKGALMLIPSSAVESMGMGGLMGAAALQQAQLTGGDRRSRQSRRRAHVTRTVFANEHRERGSRGFGDIIFTVLVPGTIALYVPFRIAGGSTPRGGWWEAGG